MFYPYQILLLETAFLLVEAQKLVFLIPLDAGASEVQVPEGPRCPVCTWIGAEENPKASWNRV